MNNMLTGTQIQNISNTNAKNYNTNYGTTENDIADWLGIGSARRQREFESYMSNTAYQRAVKDMKAAGLNPGLMYGTGDSASTPSGSSSSSGKGIGTIANIASVFSNTAKVMKAVHDIRTDKRLAENAINISKRIGFK